MLKSFQILDDLSLASSIGIEVQVKLEDGHPRWCTFITPQSLATCGYILTGTDATINYAPHMIVVSDINADIIEAALRYLEAEGDLEFCTRAYGDVGPYGKPDIREAPPEYDPNFMVEDDEA